MGIRPHHHPSRIKDLYREAFHIQNMGGGQISICALATE